LIVTLRIDSVTRVARIALVVVCCDGQRPTTRPAAAPPAPRTLLARDAG
jgi:hypothetical protein